MQQIKEIAIELSKGNVVRASKIQEETKLDDEVLRAEVEEIVRQAIISYLKKGDVENAKLARKCFSLSADAANEAVKQAVLSTISEGNIKRAVKIKEELPVSEDVCEDVISYFISWGKQKEALAIRSVFFA